MSKPTQHYGKWRIRWTDEHGTRVSDTFDSYQDALFELRKREVEVQEVKRGYRAPRIENKSFNELCDYYIEKRLPRKRDRANVESIIRKHLRPHFGHLLLKGLRVSHIDEFQAQRAHLDVKTVSNHLTVLITMLNVAVELHWLPKAPKVKKPKVRIFSSDYRYLKTNAEIDRFLSSAKSEGEMIYTLYALAVYTGLRKGEIAALKKSCVDFRRRLITVENSFDGPTKGGSVRYVPILDPLLPILKNWFLKSPGNLLFCNQAGNMLQETSSVFKEVFFRVLENAGFPEVPVKGKMCRYIRFHDLRHTFASHWVMNGGDIFKLQKILGHESIQMTMRYAHLAPNAYVDDYERLGKSTPLDSHGISRL